MTTLTGLHIPLITPFGPDGEVALPALERLAHEVLDAGAAGLVALGTTGEPSALTPLEQAAIINLLGRVAAERDVPLLSGVDSEHPAITGRLTLVPPFVRPGEDGVIAYLTARAAVSPVPLVIYHVPYRTGQDLSAEALRRIAAIPGVIGIKYAAGGIDATTIDLMANLPAGFAVLGGDDPFLAPMLALGAHGAVTASAHVATADFAALIEAWHKEARHNGEVDRPRGHRLARLSAALFAEPNPTVIKGVLFAQGRIPTAGVRLPLLPAGAATVTAAMSHLDRS